MEEAMWPEKKCPELDVFPVANAGFWGTSCPERVHNILLWTRTSTWCPLDFRLVSAEGLTGQQFALPQTLFACNCDLLESDLAQWEAGVPTPPGVGVCGTSRYG